MLRAKLWRVATIVAAWALAGLMMALYDELLRQSLGAEVVGYDIRRAVVLKTLGTATGGSIAALLVVFAFKGPLRAKPFSLVVMGEGLTFAVTAIVVTSLFARVAPDARFASLARSPWSPLMLKWVLFALVLGGLTSFALEVHDRIGQGAFLGFLTGRYHKARSEIRCFMFLDLKGSTAHAERLGSGGYYELLNAFFADATDAILETQGEIYQYVGDEIVVSWREATGLDNGNCVRCFFLIREIVERNADRYRRRFGAVPRFRAAFHLGRVTAGEVGILKRERVFTGDTLNTAARIEERCGGLGLDTLVSGDLAASLPDGFGYSLRPVEEIQLRGKGSPTALFTIEHGVPQVSTDHQLTI